jgi:hypothetical protein
MSRYNLGRLQGRRHTFPQGLGIALSLVRIFKFGSGITRLFHSGVFCKIIRKSTMVLCGILRKSRMCFLNLQQIRCVFPQVKNKDRLFAVLFNHLNTKNFWKKSFAKRVYRLCQKIKMVNIRRMNPK